MSQDIKILIKILKKKGKNKLASLLIGCDSYIEESGQYGSYLFSIISSFIILAQVEKFFELKKIIQNRKDILIETIKHIYPDKAYSPEITDVGLEILKDDSKIQDANINLDKEVHAFIGYSSKDKTIAHKFSSIFEKWGIKHFLAHEDIDITEQWKEEILKNLFSCNVLVLILTENFKKSDYTAQEIGIVLGRRKDTLIIPIKKDVDPYGFFSHIQAGKLTDANLELSIIKKIYFRFPSMMFSKLMDYLSKSTTFRDAESRLNFVSECIGKSLDTNKINEILKIALINGQIYAANRCRDWIIEQIKSNKNLDESIIKEYKKNYYYKNLI